MSQFVLTEKAKGDLKAIGLYTQSTWGKLQRNRYLSALDEEFSEIANHPEIGVDCGYIREGYRKYPVGKHVIYYRKLGKDLIEIVRILHESMDIDAQLS